MCEWCSDLRNVEPAKYISACGEDPDWLVQAKKNKLFLSFERNDDGTTSYYNILKCPYCGLKFEGNTQLYDSYD